MEIEVHFDVFFFLNIRSAQFFAVYSYYKKLHKKYSYLYIDSLMIS